MIKNKPESKCKSVSPAHFERGSDYLSDGSGEQIKADLNKKRFLTLQETALYIGKAEGYVFELVRTDKSFTAKVKLNGRVCFDRELLDQWLEGWHGGAKDKLLYKYKVVNASTGEIRIVEANNPRQARRVVRRLNGEPLSMMSNYSAKLFYEQEEDINAEAQSKR